MNVGTVTAAAVALVLGACGSSPTQVVVLMEADEIVEADAARIALEVVSLGGEVTRRGAEVGATPDHRWPFRAVIVPARAESERFLVTAEVFDAAGASLGVQRVHTHFVPGQTRYVRLRFADDCRDLRCEERTVCRAGVCESACVEPADSPEGPTPAGPCLQGRPALDGGAAPDGGRPDAGGADGGVPAQIACPTDAPAVFDFDAPLALERCPDTLPCETSPTGRLERLEPDSLLTPAEPSPCGGGVLRSSVFSSSSRNAAYLVAPTDGGGHLRAWVYLPTEGAEMVEMPSDLLSLVAADAETRDLDAPRAGVRVDAERVQLFWSDGEGGEEVELASAESSRGRWICAELDVTGGRARAGLDGVHVDLTLPPGLAEALSTTAHARAGLASLGPGENALVWMDQVAASATPLPCPRR